MQETKKLTKRQRAVIEDLFTSELEDEEVLAKHNVAPALYSRWLSDERFVEQFERRIAQAYHASRVTLARYAPVAAGKLITLTDCEKEETARKACLDIVTFNALPTAAAQSAAPQEAQTPTNVELPPEVASRLLTALTETGDEN